MAMILQELLLLSIHNNSFQKLCNHIQLNVKLRNLLIIQQTYLKSKQSLKIKYNQQEKGLTNSNKEKDFNNKQEV
jgi:hypothetical protein